MRPHRALGYLHPMLMTLEAPPQSSLSRRVDSADWAKAETDLDAFGWSLIPGLLAASECADIAACYKDDALFRNRVVMARHGFGRGEYKYFAHPLPESVQKLRAAFYPRLRPVANRWNETMSLKPRYPEDHAD